MTFRDKQKSRQVKISNKELKENYFNDVSLLFNYIFSTFNVTISLSAIKNVNRKSIVWFQRRKEFNCERLPGHRRGGIETDHCHDFGESKNRTCNEGIYPNMTGLHVVSLGLFTQKQLVFEFRSAKMSVDKIYNITSHLRGVIIKSMLK